MREEGRPSGPRCPAFRRPPSHSLSAETGPGLSAAHLALRGRPQHGSSLPTTPVRGPAASGVHPRGGVPAPDHPNQRQSPSPARETRPFMQCPEKHSFRQKSTLVAESLPGRGAETLTSIGVKLALLHPSALSSFPGWGRAPGGGGGGPWVHSFPDRFTSWEWVPVLGGASALVSHLPEGEPCAGLGRWAGALCLSLCPSPQQPPWQPLGTGAG